jgi:peptidyl-prolyl cis-trans isomerase A (cyclophilin A)
VIPGFMIQGGGMDAQMNEKPTGAPIRNEARNGLRNLRGTVAMARTNAPDSATAEFFINLKDNAGLDFGIRGAGYAVFGEVLEGMDVVDKIAATPTTSRGHFDDVPSTTITIRTARVEGAAKPGAVTGRPASPRPRPATRPSPKPSPGA